MYARSHMHINDCFLQDLAMAEALVKDMIQKNSVMVFSKTYCPFCTMAKEALRDAGLKEVNIHTRNSIYNHAVYNTVSIEIYLEQTAITVQWFMMTNFSHCLSIGTSA